MGHWTIDKKGKEDNKDEVRDESKTLDVAASSKGRRESGKHQLKRCKQLDVEPSLSMSKRAHAKVKKKAKKEGK